MPRRNRVTPFGEIVAVPERGMFLGNRGVLHDAAGQIRRAWQVRRWLVCRLEFRGRRRPLMRPGYYTALFFLDEATALAAGHRPCAECRRERYNTFRDAWARANPRLAESPRPRAEVIDDRLHAERAGAGGTLRSFAADLDRLPDGTFLRREGDPTTAFLLWAGHLHAWSSGGYRARLPRPRGERVAVLTPRSTVGALRAGYVPVVHESACSG